MVQWEDPAVEARLADINTNITFLLLGLYGWEYFQSLDVEYAVIRGRLAFRWVLIPYIIGRMSLFVFLLLLAIRTDPPSSSFLCLPASMAMAVLGDIGVGCSSLNFMIRTWMIWKDSHWVHGLLLIVMLGHWIILVLGNIANMQGVEVDGHCGVGIAHPTMNGAVFVYFLCYDFLVLVLAIVGLSRQPSKSPLRKRLRAQGILYFVVTLITYISPTVFSFLGVALMESITGLVAMAASTIASCRAVRSLLGHRTKHSSETSEETAESDVALTTQIPLATITPTVIC